MPKQSNRYLVDLCDDPDEKEWPNVPPLLIKCARKIESALNPKNVKRLKELKPVYTIDGTESNLKDMVEKLGKYKKRKEMLFKQIERTQTDNDAEIFLVTDFVKKMISKINEKCKLIDADVSKTLLSLLNPDGEILRTSGHMNNFQFDADLVNKVANSLKKLPIHNLHTVIFLLNHLHKVSNMYVEQNEHTQMTYDIGLMFGDIMFTPAAKKKEQVAQFNAVAVKLIFMAPELLAAIESDQDTQPSNNAASSNKKSASKSGAKASAKSSGKSPAKSSAKSSSSFLVDLCDNPNEELWPNVPPLLIACARKIESALATEDVNILTLFEGLYRKSPKKEKVNNLLDKLGKYEQEKHTLFKEIENTLVDNGPNMYLMTEFVKKMISQINDKCELINAAVSKELLLLLNPKGVKTPSDSSKNSKFDAVLVKKVANSLKKLPIHNLHTVIFLLNHVHKVSNTHVEQTKMDANNIGLVLGPNMFNSASNDPLEVLKFNEVTVKLIFMAPQLLAAIESDPDTQPATKAASSDKKLASKSGAKASPGTSSAQSPGTSSAKSPGTSSSKSPGTSSSKSPGTSSAKSAGTSSAKSPGTSSVQSPGTSSAKSPGRLFAISPITSTAQSPQAKSGKDLNLDPCKLKKHKLKKRSQLVTAIETCCETPAGYFSESGGRIQCTIERAIEGTDECKIVNSNVERIWNTYVKHKDRGIALLKAEPNAKVKNQFILKFLTMLEEPLINEENFNVLVKFGRARDPLLTAIAIEYLPKENQRLIYYLLSHLHPLIINCVAHDQKLSGGAMMTDRIIDELAELFGPALVGGSSAKPIAKDDTEADENAEVLHQLLQAGTKYYEEALGVEDLKKLNKVSQDKMAAYKGK